MAPRKPTIKRTDENGVPRDSYDRPVLIGPHGEPQAYTRTSTLAETLAEKGPALTDWAVKNGVAGTVINSDIWWEAEAIYRQHGADPFDRDGKSAWRELTQRARKVAGEDRWSQVGTDIHAMVEFRHKAGYHSPFEKYQQWLRHAENIWDTIDNHGYDVLDVEIFVVNDELGCAGTADLLLRDRETGEIKVGDLKTGSHDAAYPLKVMVQVATYANSVRYNLETTERTPLADEPISNVGVLVHCPAKFKPATKLYPLDLQKGLKLARLSVDVRSERAVPKLVPLTGPA